MTLYEATMSSEGMKKLAKAMKDNELSKDIQAERITLMDSTNREIQNEMNAPVFREYNPDKPWVIVAKDYDEGSRAMWREYERFSSKEEAQSALRSIRDNQNAYEDRTGYESLVSYKIVEEK